MNFVKMTLILHCCFQILSVLVIKKMSYILHVNIAEKNIQTGLWIRITQISAEVAGIRGQKAVLLVYAVEKLTITA